MCAKETTYRRYPISSLLLHVSVINLIELSSKTIPLVCFTQQYIGAHSISLIFMWLTILTNMKSTCLFAIVLASGHTAGDKLFDIPTVHRRSGWSSAIADGRLGWLGSGGRNATCLPGQ